MSAPDEDGAAPHQGGGVSPRVRFEGTSEAATLRHRPQRRQDSEGPARHESYDGDDIFLNREEVFGNIVERPGYRDRDEGDVADDRLSQDDLVGSESFARKPKWQPPAESPFLPQPRRSERVEESPVVEDDWQESIQRPGPRDRRSTYDDDGIALDTDRRRAAPASDESSRSRSPLPSYQRRRYRDHYERPSGLPARTGLAQRSLESIDRSAVGPSSPRRFVPPVSTGSRNRGPQSYDSNRHRSLRTSRGTARGRSGSISEDDGEPYDKIGFTLSSQSIAESSRDGESDAEPPESEQRASLNDDKMKPKPTHSLAISASQYTGNAELGGSHTATLTAVHGPTDRKQALFRWLHVHQDVMNLEEFWAEVFSLSDLTDLEKRALSRLRTDVKSSVKSKHNPRGEKVAFMEPRHIDVPLKSLEKKMEADATQGSARWICIPYFSLQQYSGLLSGSNLSQFPPQTLLQVQYSRSNVQRDMEQAVCQLGHSKRGECFHVCQLWSIVIDNSLLVTCGTMTQSDLQGDTLKVNDEPSRNIVAGDQGHILVLFGESTSWSLTIAECQTWFAFISKFQAFWPQTLEFWYNTQLVTAEKWHRICRLAKKSRSSITLRMKIGTLPKAPMCGILQSDSNERGLKQGCGGKSEHGFVHVMMFPQGDRKRASTDVQLQLNAAHRLLTSETPVSSRSAYNKCETATRKECYDYLVSLSEGMGDQLAENQDEFKESIDVYNAADVLYRFFLPHDCEGQTIGKFWGAIKTMIKSVASETNDVHDDMVETVSSIRTYLRQLVPKLIAFQDIVSHASKEERSALEMPQDFATAWLNVVMVMVYGSQANQGWQRRADYLNYFIEGGMDKFMRWLPDKNLLERASMLPIEVLSLVTLGLLQDHVGKSDDITETYSQYLGSLDSSIMSKPSDRSYQHRIDLVQQEMTLIMSTLRRQWSVVAKIQRSLAIVDTLYPNDPQNRDEVPNRKRNVERPIYRTKATALMSAETRRDEMYPTTVETDMGFDEEPVQEMALDLKLSPTDAGGLRQLLFDECSKVLQQRHYEFVRDEDYATYLEQTNTFRMNFTKDRQENAIFAFTIVTIIFLPLSAVSSIFGMNTVDVRDMEASQWLYWAVALPVTALVILAGLWWMGELANITRWLMRKPRLSYGSGAVLMAPQTMQEQDVDEQETVYYPSVAAMRYPPAYNAAPATTIAAAAVPPVAPRVTTMDVDHAPPPSFSRRRQGRKVPYHAEMDRMRVSGARTYVASRPSRRSAFEPSSRSRSYYNG